MQVLKEFEFGVKDATEITNFLELTYSLNK